VPEDYDIIFLLREYYIRSFGLYSIHGTASEMGRFYFRILADNYEAAHLRFLNLV